MMIKKDGILAGIEIEAVGNWDGSSAMTDDGRPIVMVQDGVAYAPAAAALADMLQREMESERQREADRRTASQDDVHEGIAAATCPQMSGGKPCGGALNRRGVCPSCVTGRMGYRYRYTCESCGCDIVTREELR